jgi:four helix bundle protein
MKYDLEKRLIAFAVLILDIVEQLPNTKGSNHLGNQLVRSGTAPALLYGEAQAPESRRDFIHKMKVALKELRETFICMKIIHEKTYLIDDKKLLFAMQENSELISIFMKSVGTASRNLKRMMNTER